MIKRPDAKRTPLHRWGLCALLLLTAAAPAAPPVRLGQVVMAQHPFSELGAIARKVAAADLEDGGKGALMLVASQSLGTAGTWPALFVQVQSQRACGSAGCSVSVYLPTKTGWTKVVDAVGTLTVLASTHGGMHDLLVGKGDHWIWNGKAYVDTLPAPQVDLRPRHPTTKTRPHSRPSTPRPG